ncbi:MAG: hypothetical protein HOM47_01980, partial [Euryarchaeota archaeon]|nr:hypothetical protein [Euryarchaeota archaeon]
MANHSKLWVALFLSVLMVGMTQNSYVNVDEEVMNIFSEQKEDTSKSSPLNLSSGYSPKTFVDDAKFFDSVRAESVSVGFYNSCIVYDDQSLTCTGYNYLGLLGVGFVTPTPHFEKEHIRVNFPESVKISQVKVGYDSTCAIDTDGGLWCWGSNSHGKSGTDLPDSYIISPERVLIDENESVHEVAIGNNHKCALTDSKKIFCWGNNNYGQSLLPHSGSVNIPTEVEMDSDIVPVSISGKQEHTCILNQNGAVYCWGYNAYGQLGDGTTTNRNEMVQSILPSSDPAVYLVAGYTHSCALLESGDMRCWGRNHQGQLGVKSNTPISYKYPTDVLDLPLEPISFDLGFEHTCALLKTQTSLCWGLNNYGQLGDGTTTGFNTNGYNGEHKQVSTSANSKYYYNSIGLSVGSHTACSIFDTGKV